MRVGSHEVADSGGTMKNEQVAELLYQALETEKGGIQVYETALTCVVNADLKKEWEEYLEQTRNHERIVLEVMDKLGLGLDPDLETRVARHARGAPAARGRAGGEDRDRSRTRQEGAQTDAVARSRARGRRARGRAGPASPSSSDSSASSTSRASPSRSARPRGPVRTWRPSPGRGRSADSRAGRCRRIARTTDSDRCSRGSRPRAARGDPESSGSRSPCPTRARSRTSPSTRAGATARAS